MGIDRKDYKKIIMDKFMVTIFLLLLFINIFAHYLVEAAGGVLNLFVVYSLFIYFTFFYGKKIRHIKKLSFCIFLFVYIFERQFLWNFSDGYSSFGFLFERSVWNLVSFVPMMFSAIAIFEKSRTELINWCKKIFILSITIVCVVSIVMLIGDNTLSKKTATTEGYYQPFLINFAVCYSLVICLPLIICWCGKSKNKILSIIFLLLIFATVVLSSYVIAIMGTIVGIICYLLFKIKDRNLRLLIIFIAVIFIIFIFASNVMVDILYALSKVISLEEVSKRFEQIALFLSSGVTGDTTVRIDLYVEMFNNWLKHPFLGNIIYKSNIKLSGHSTNLDILSGCGILGFVFYIKFIVDILKSNLNGSLKRRAAVVSSFIVLLFLSTFNPIFASSQIMVMYVLSPLLFLEEKMEN